MAGASRDDALGRWLSEHRSAVLDVLTAESMDVILVLDRELTTRYINRIAVAGLSRDAVIGQRAPDLLPPADQAAAIEVYGQVLRTGIAARFETTYRDEQAGVLIWDVRVNPVRDGSEMIGLMVITSNVTEQRRASADRDRFFSLSLDMLLVGTPEGRLKRVNPAFGAALGYDIAELEGKHFIELVHADDQAPTLEVFGAMLRGQPVTNFENRLRRRDGEHRVFSWRANVDPLTGDIYAVARDVSDQRTVEAQLRHAQKMEAVGQLAGGVAHDFNNLLQAVLVHVDLVVERLDEGSPFLESMREIELAGRRAADLTKQLLAFSRRQLTRPVPIDLNARIDGLLNMLRRLLPANIAIDLRREHELLTISADPTQLEQVIVNLCVNARDAMPSGGTLTIATSNATLGDELGAVHATAPSQRFVLLRVSDTGVGMTPAVRERVFEPFFTTKSAQGGTGLGLSTVYGIVQQHGGSVRVHSTLSEGATFELYFPEDGRAPDRSTPPERVRAAPGRETILFAEDEDLVRNAVVLLLVSAGYRVLVASNGLEAVRLLREHDGEVHLALLDVVMPELDGPETWAHLQLMRPGLKGIFATGYADGGRVERLPPSAEVIQKPFLSSELLARIRRKLDR